MSIPANFIYFGLFLNNNERDILINFVTDNFQKIINKPNIKFYLNHVTLFHCNDKHQTRFREYMYEILNLMFHELSDEIYKVTITHYGYNDKAFAFKVELPDGFPCFMFKTYHITIATFNRAKPVESNNIINWYKLGQPIVVNTILKKVYNENI